MNITQARLEDRLEVIKSIKADNLADFSSAMADATHYLIEALTLLSSIDPDIDSKSQELWQAFTVAKSYYELAERVAAVQAEDALQEAYDIIAGDIDPTDPEQLATELMRGWN
jgi:hypothetical protein